MADRTRFCFSLPLCIAYLTFNYNNLPVGVVFQIGPGEKEKANIYTTLRAYITWYNYVKQIQKNFNHYGGPSDYPVRRPSLEFATVVWLQVFFLFVLVSSVSQI